MTQAFNLSQLANNLSSTGQLDATDGLVNAVPVANGGTGASTASAARTNLGVAAAVFAVPSGGIIMWSGSVASIPSGWFLCDGLNSTPNLTDRFVIGAGNSYAVNATGGSKDAIVVSHSHTASSSVSDPGHAHEIRQGFSYGGGGNNYPATDDGDQYGSMNSYSATTGISVSTSVNSTGSSGTNANLPPYFALCFIMKS
jgi:hypothetical protein